MDILIHIAKIDTKSKSPFCNDEGNCSADNDNDEYVHDDSKMLPQLIEENIKIKAEHYGNS